jgi:signal transduction histidine kinase
LNSAGGLATAVQEKYKILELNADTLNGTCAMERRTIVRSNMLNSDNPQTKFTKVPGIQSAVCHPLLMDSKLIGTMCFVSRNRNQFNPDEIEFTRMIAQYVAIAIDRSRTVRALHEARLQLGDYASSLENKVGQRTSELEQSLKAMESFSYSLAHDVRAPLRHIRGFADALQEDCGAELSSKGKEYIDLILRAIQRLDSLTKDIMAYGQLSQQSSPKTLVDLEALLNDIISTHTELQAPEILTIRKPLHKPLAERFLLEQCLTNLLDNALKFVPKGVAPRIAVSTELTNKCVRISIEDNGIGVPAQFRDKIFGVFERLPAPQSYEGTGIGLAIVAKATQQMDGRFGVEPLKNRGSRFWIELPSAEV